MVKNKAVKSKIPDDMHIGSIHKSKNHGDIEVIEYVNYLHVVVRFISTGWESTEYANTIRNGYVRDRLAPTLCGIGIIGDGKYKAFVNGKATRAHVTWSKMFERCYSAKRKKTLPTYEGCTVDPRWHLFQSFAKWHEENYVEGYHLDKDKLVKGNKLYSSETCCFITGFENVSIAKAKTYQIINPDGELIEVHNMARFAAKHKLHRGRIGEVANGLRASYKGYTTAKGSGG